MTITRNFNLRLNAGTGISPVINANQFDEGEEWIFTLLESDGTVYTPSTGSIIGLKSDGTTILDAGTVNAEGQVIITETVQMTASSGKNVYELLIDGDSHGTANFIVFVEPRPGDIEHPSETELSLFEETIQAAGNVQQFQADISALQSGLATTNANLTSEANTRASADATLQSAISTEASTRSTQDAVLQAEIDQIIAPSGEAPSAAEVQNARIGVDGTTYDTLGNAIRGQVGDLKNALSTAIDLDFDTVADTFIIKTNGNTGTSTGYIASDYIGVNDAIWLYSFCGNDNSGYAFYDEAKTPLSYGGIYSFNRTWTKLTAPIGAKYFRATCGVNQASEFAMKLPLANGVERLFSDNASNTLEGINYDSGYIINNDGEIGSFVSSASYVSKKMLVETGEVYHINGVGGSSARLWSTHDALGNTLRVAVSDLIQPNSAVDITIADGEKYLVFNSMTAAARYGVTSGDASRSTYNTRDLLMNVETDVENIEFTFKNNMSTDGKEKLPKCTITNGNYGDSGAKYTFNMPSNKMHIYFEFKQTTAVSSTSSSSYSKRLINANKVGYLYLAYKGSVYQNTELSQKYTFQVLSGSNSGSLTPTALAYSRLNGEDAFSIQYTNTVDANSVCTVDFGASAVTVNVDGTTSTISVTSATTLTDLLTSLNAISGISAEALIVNGKTYADLLPVVSKSSASSTTLNLIYSGSLYDSTSYIDNPKVYVPLAVSNEWHSVEMIIDPYGSVSAALDGITVSATYDSTVVTANSLIINDGAMPIVIRNLEVDYGSEGDAEIVDNLVAPGTTPSKQLISSHNPRVLIYEGHGVDVCTDAEAPISDTMACSTERLRILFDTARAKGYVPVTWEDIVEWKLNGKPLPKRCFTMMFDDWRFENFVDYDKRKPFLDANVKAGLAVITNDKVLSDTVTINGISYTAEQCVDIVKTAGWYPTSHTHGHRRINDYTPTANVALFKEDVLEADRYGIHSNILVYPYGEFEQQYLGALKHSGFGLGVNIVRNSYNCRGTNNYYLVRVEVGTRVSLSTALYPLV